MTPEISAGLAASGIQMAAQAKDYCMFVRGECLALARMEDGRFTSIGSSGILTERGLAYLVWVDGKAMLSAHGSRTEATAAQVDAIRNFSEDLKNTISAADEHR
ncbi:MAG TPA: hypothetical protein VMB03_03280 [Bryobacteraceae bacterium]|nr:hypothetical protein [Bryobacteraceae bacterium]